MCIDTGPAIVSFGFTVEGLQCVGRTMAKPEPVQRPRRRLPLPPARRAKTSPSQTRATCADALRTIARDCLSAVEQHHADTHRGNADALHEMRIALTRLRTALLFFAPAIKTPATERLRREARWLNGKLGAARDLDVSLRGERPGRAHNERVKHWQAERQRRYAKVKRTLRTKRYRQFIEALRNWTARRSASGSAGTQAADSFSIDRLSQWQAKLLRRADRLDRLGTRKRHKLRIRTKRFRYALEWSVKLAPSQARKRTAMIVHAKTIQESLGRLNDSSQHRTLAKTRHLKPLPRMNKLETPKTQQRLLKTATKAFRELGRTPLA